MDRRKFLRMGGFVTASVVGMGLSACGGGSAASGRRWKFPQSVASGDPRPDAIMLWTRVVPTSADDVASADAGDFSIRLLITGADNSTNMGSNAALVGPTVVDATVPVKASYDHTVRHKVSGLSPAKVYYYQFVAGDVRSNVGRFKTAPAQDADVSQLKFGMLTCQDWSINHWGAFTDVVQQDLDFVVHLGDYIYETVGEAFQTGAVEARHTALQLPNGTYKSGTSGAKYATTLADYRYLYKQYRTDTRLQAVHERFAMIAIWDDHEFSDDCWVDAETYDNGTFDNGVGDNTHQSQRRRSANQAWYEFMPADIYFTTDASAGVQNVQIYRDLQFGKLAHLVMTDERLYRSDHVIPEAAVGSSIGSRYMVPEALLASTEAQKMAAAQTAGLDPLTPVSMLGETQRAWWQDKMRTSSATWKLWGNEVSLLRMGLNGTDAIATLLALNAIGTLATNIGNTAANATGGNVSVAAAIVAAVTAGADQATAGNAGTAIATADAMSADTSAAAVAAGLTPAQAGIAVACYNAAKAAAAGGATAQAGAAAQTLAFGYIKPDVQANKQNSSFVVAAGKQAALAPYFNKFLLNCDQWDGYNSERKALMQYIQGNGIKNVVAITGDIHSFFAGEVRDDFSAVNGGSPVIVDLVTAGVSSDSFFNYLKAAVVSLSTDMATLVYYPLSVPVPGAGTLSLNVNLLNYTMGAAAPTAATLADSLRVQLRGALAKAGLPEAQLDATTSAVLAGLKSDSNFTGQLLPLAQQLAGLNSNPWLKHLNTDAQGYAVITITPTALNCEFRQVNKLVGNAAPTNPVVAKITTATVQKDVVNVTVS